jgi:16S rRNA (guanine527-N7)-methyltransferase
VEQSLDSLLTTALTELGLAIPSDAQKAFLKYLDLVLETNKTMNLTAITDPAEAVHKHLVDSVSALLLKDLASQAMGSPAWMDIGSGAGMPGFPLALAVPTAQVSLVESTGKKAHFLEMTAAQLGLLKRVRVFNTRAESLGQKEAKALSAKEEAAAVSRGTAPLPSLRETQDAVFFRGVSRMNALCELGSPLLKVGGLLVAYKGPKAAEELAEAGRALKEFKFELAERLDFMLPGANEARILICLRKTSETTKRYPRLIGLAQKEPLV